MKRALASDTLRDLVMVTLRDCDGVRAAAADKLGVSLRTLNRYIADLNMYQDIDKEGLRRNAGPPLKAEGGGSRRLRVLVDYIQETGGNIDYGVLAKRIYGADTATTRQRLYTALNEYQRRGIVGSDGHTWFIIKSE